MRFKAELFFFFVILILCFTPLVFIRIPIVSTRLGSLVETKLFGLMLNQQFHHED